MQNQRVRKTNVTGLPEQHLSGIHHLICSASTLAWKKIKKFLQLQSVHLLRKSSESEWQTQVALESNHVLEGCLSFPNTKFLFVWLTFYF